MSRSLPQVTTVSVRETYEKHLRLMEENKAICDEIIAEEEAKAQYEIHRHPPTLDTTWELLAKSALNDNPQFALHSGKYRFHQARVNTLAGILQLAQNEKIIARLTEIASKLETR